jgi:hypothetical protein
MLSRTESTFFFGEHTALNEDLVGVENRMKMQYILINLKSFVANLVIAAIDERSMCNDSHKDSWRKWA